MSKFDDVQKAAQQQSDAVQIEVNKVILQASGRLQGDAVVGYFNNDQQENPNRWFGIKASDVGMLTLINTAYAAVARDQKVLAILAKRVDEHGWDISVLSVV